MSWPYVLFAIGVSAASATLQYLHSFEAAVILWLTGIFFLMGQIVSKLDRNYREIIRHDELVRSQVVPGVKSDE